MQPQDISESKSKPKAEVKKETYVKPKYYSSFNQSSLIINSTESTKRDIANIKNWIYENTDLSWAPFDIDVDLTSSYGVKDSFRIGNLNFSAVEKDSAQKYRIFTIGSIACNGSVMGYGVNEARLIEIMFKELEFPKPLTLSDKYSCKYDDIAFDLNGIDQINGDESLESLQYEIGKQAFDIVIPLFENMDSYSETETSYNQNVWRVQNKVLFSFGNSSLSIYFDVDSETDVSIIYKLFSEAKKFLNSVLHRSYE